MAQYALGTYCYDNLWFACHMEKRPFGFNYWVLHTGEEICEAEENHLIWVIHKDTYVQEGCALMKFKLHSYYRDYRLI